MNKFIASFFLILTIFICQGSGYIGDKPDIESFFTQENIEPDEIINTEVKKDNIKEEQSEIALPPEVENNVEDENGWDVKKLGNDLAPSNINSDNINIVKHAKKPQYVVDILEFSERLNKLNKVIKTTSNLQVFAAKANVFDFYTKSFLFKYKEKPLSKQNVYEKIRSLNQDTQLILGLWIEARDNSKYLPYSAFNGSYQPSVIRAKLNELSDEFEDVIDSIRQMNL